MKFNLKHFRREDAACFLLASLLVIVYVAGAGPGFPLDDSWIHQVYARNLAESGQWAFVPGQPSAASTSPLYTVLLTIGYIVPVDSLLWTHFLGWLALSFAGMIAARMGAMILPNFRSGGIIIGFAAILAWHHVWAAVSGMETMLFGTLTLLLIYLAWLEMQPKDGTSRGIILRGLVFGVFAALTTLARPEGILLAGMIGLAMLIARPQGSLRAVMLWGIGAGVGFGVFITPYLLLNVQLTGGLLPNTAAAKLNQNAPLLNAAYPARVLSMLVPLSAGGQIFLVPGLLYYALRMSPGDRRRRVLILLPVLWGIALVALYAARLPAPYQHGRYVIPGLPAWILAGTAGTILLLQNLRHTPAGRVFSRTLALGAALTFVGFVVLVGPGEFRKDVAIIQEEMVAAAHWIAENVPAEELLVIHDIGAVGYFAPRPILDLAGLVSPEVIPVINEAAALWTLMQNRGGRYLMAFPDQIPGDNPADTRLCEVFNTGGQTSRQAGGPNMAVYRISWLRECER